MTKITLILPPLTQLNTPYPSTAYLAQFLGTNGIPSRQRDLGIELFHRIFCEQGLTEVFEELDQKDMLPDPAWRSLSLANAHLRAIGPVMSFLRGQDSGLAPLLLNPHFLPRGPALAAANSDAFGVMGTVDRARYLATLYIKDLTHLVATIEPGFGLAQYQHHLAIGAKEFDPLYQRLQNNTLIDGMLDELTDTINSEFVGLSVPFPGNLYGALRIGKRLKERGVHVIMGGGYVNTELREVNEPRLWQFVDSLTFDDGEGPLLALLQHKNNKTDRRHRTLTKEGPINNPAIRPPFTSAGDYGDLDLSLYLQLIDTLNPAHRLWADGRWNKMTLAHGCYWRKCSFCDVHLDYISHYENTTINNLVDHMERLIGQTGQRGFHFVDEAAPPKVLKALAIEVLRRNLGVTMWGNIRFEKSFTPDLCRLLSAAGMVAVTGGLEVANERLLKKIRKGVTVEQVTRAAKAFQEAGVMVHAYLMYGFPGQTAQETLDSMEVVRQLFENEVIDSAFWHRFVLTRHSPIYRELDHFGVTLAEDASERAFAANDLPHVDALEHSHDRFDEVLPVALNQWMMKKQLKRPVHSWFKAMPTTTESPTRIADALNAPTRQGRRLLWIGGEGGFVDGGVQLETNTNTFLVPCSEEQGQWLLEVIEAASPTEEEPLLLADVLDVFPGDWLLFNDAWQLVREAGLLLI